MIDEIHTGDLTASCLRALYHKHRGEVEPVAQTALFRGSLANETLVRMHRDKMDPNAALVASIPYVQDRIVAEGRILSETVKRDVPEIAAEVATALHAYERRIMPLIRQCEVIGVEVPVRMEIEGTAPFASHIDLILRDRTGAFGYGERTIVIDWKWTDTAPPIAYLSRNMQLAMYYVATKYGYILVNDDWVNLGEFPAMVWCHLPALLPYKRKTTKQNGDVYAAGDEKPIEDVLRLVRFVPGMVNAILAEYRLREKMMSLDLWPTNPDPVGCQICQSRDWCTRFDMMEER